MSLKPDDLVRLLDLNDARGLALTYLGSAAPVAVGQQLREILRLAALGAALEEHVRYEHPTGEVKSLHAGLTALWPRDTP